MFVLEKAYGPVIFSVMVKGVMIVFFSLTLMLHISRDTYRYYEGGNSQLLALIEVHDVLAELESGQHIQNLPDIRIRALDQLVHDVRRDLQLLPDW